MPKIILQDDLLDPFWVKSIMNFPEDKNKQDQHFAYLKTDFETRDALDSEIFNVDAKTLKLILDTPSRNDLKLEITEATKQAIVAGDVLVAIYLMDKFGLSRPSLNKAFFVSQAFAKNNTYGDGTPMAVSIRYVKERWSAFKSVAHLWGAWRLNMGYPIVDQTSLFSEEFETFLGIAKELQDFGLRFIPLGAKPQLPIMQNDSVWLLPDKIKAITLKSYRKPDLLIKYLKKYKAPKSQY